MKAGAYTGILKRSELDAFRRWLIEAKGGVEQPVTAPNQLWLVKVPGRRHPVVGYAGKSGKAKVAFAIDLVSAFWTGSEGVETPQYLLGSDLPTEGQKLVSGDPDNTAGHPGVGSDEPIAFVRKTYRRPEHKPVKQGEVIDGKLRSVDGFELMQHSWLFGLDHEREAFLGWLEAEKARRR